MLILIVDAGSTKTECIVMRDGRVERRFLTRGYNPNYNSPTILGELLYQDIPQAISDVDAVYYYGSGCGATQNKELVAQQLRARFPQVQKMMVTHDLMAVCHAVLGHEKGIACILGTGANSCLYNGQEITEQAVSLGYLLGDEGSGCYIGRKLVRAFFYEQMPLELMLSFKQSYNLEIKELIHHVYHEQGASQYLAQFTKFAGEHLDHPFIQHLVKGCFSDFIHAFVLRYKDCRSLPVCFVGSVAYYFQELLQESLEAEGMSLGKVRQTPAEGLIRFYQVEN